MSSAHASSHEPLDHRRWRLAVVIGLTVPLFVWAASLAPIAQDLTYHRFADQRAFYGMPHFWNVLSNLPFAAIGLLGCWWVLGTRRASRAFEDPGERFAYVVFFVGEFLTCFGSGYYHAGPSNDTLVWDRLVFSLMLTSIFSIVIAEFVDRRFGRLMLAPMVVLGLFSVLYWAWSESVGRGDLRLYFTVQFYPMVAIPVILLLFRSRYSHARTFWLMWALYACAKFAELYDAPLYEWTGFWSGHTVKHLIAAGASSIPLWNLRRRTSMSAGLSSRAPRSQDLAESPARRVVSKTRILVSSIAEKTSSALSIKAVIAGSVIGVVGSLAALLVVVLLSQVQYPSHGIWFAGLTLVLALSMIGGFITARAAGRHELTHAAVTALPFLLMSVWIYPGAEFRDVMPGGGGLPPNPTWHDTVVYGLILGIVPAALAGAYLARASRSFGQSLLPSRLTYGAMAVWGIAESLDSLPSLIGLAPAVYAGIVALVALLLATVSSMVLMFYGSRVHKRRVALWYCLLLCGGFLTSVGLMPRLMAEIPAAVIAMLWLVHER